MRKEAAGETHLLTRRRTASWSGIPPEFLSDIRKCLTTRLEVTRFRSVCKNWRSSVPLPKNPNFLTPFFPLQIPNPKYLPFNKQGYDSLDLVPSSVFLVQQVVDSNSPNSSNLISNCWILTVEELQPGKLRLLYPLGKEPMSNVCKSLNLLDFRMSEIGKSYSFRSFSGSISDCKVVVCSDNAGRVAAANSATDFTAVVLYSMGDLFGIRLENGVWRNDRIQSVLWFKDVICFKGKFFAVIGGGKLYVVDQLAFKVTEAVVNDFVCESDSLIKLVESSGELLLVVMDEFKVYRLDELRRKWEVVQALGDRIMFLGSDCSFLVPTEDLLRHKGNFVVSSSVMNSSKAKPIELTENFWIYVSCLDVGSKKKLKSSYHSITSILRPPSILFSPNSLPSSRESEGIDKVLQSPVGLVGGSPSLQPENLELTLVPPHSSSKKSALKEIVVKSEDQGQPEVYRCLDLVGHPAVKGRIDSNLLLSHSLVQKHVFEQESPRYAIVQTESNAPSVEAELSEEASTVKFKGIDVKSVYLPILQKVWMKHGDVIEGSAIRSSDIMASALDALAKMIRILQTNSGKTLTDAQARYLGSTLSDLQLMHLKVDWLVPFVQKALASQKNKQLQADLLELDRLRTLAEEMERDFLAVMVKVKQDIESDRRLVSKSMQVTEAIDLEICLGEGLC